MWGKATCWLVLISASVPPIWPLFKFLRDRAPRLSLARGTRSRSERSTGVENKRSSFIRLEEGRGAHDDGNEMQIVKKVHVSTTLERSSTGLDSELGAGDLDAWEGRRGRGVSRSRVL